MVVIVLDIKFKFKGKNGGGMMLVMFIFLFRRVEVFFNLLVDFCLLVKMVFCYFGSRGDWKRE